MKKAKIISILLAILTCQLYAQPVKTENRLSYKVIFYAGGVPSNALNADNIKNLDSIQIIDNHGNSDYKLIEYIIIFKPLNETALAFIYKSKLISPITKDIIKKMKKGDKIVFCDFVVKNASGDEVKISKSYNFEIQ